MPPNIWTKYQFPFAGTIKSYQELPKQSQSFLMEAMAENKLHSSGDGKRQQEVGRKGNSLMGSKRQSLKD